MGLGPTPQYLAQYNNYVLPGYVQSEDMESTINIASHYGAYLDGSDSEYVGLSNKSLNLSLKVWEQDYLSCKQQIELAATMIRSSKIFTNLYVQYTDRHYVALAKSIKMSKSVPSSVRTLDYSVEFECKPWLVGETLHSISSDTNEVGRTIADGGWTPTVVTLTGNSVSGIVDWDGQSTGSIVTTGVTNMVIDTEAFTATMDAVNRNDLITTKDYRLYVGPGRTIFTVDGSATIQYYDRYYI